MLNRDSCSEITDKDLAIKTLLEVDASGVTQLQRWIREGEWKKLRDNLCYIEYGELPDFKVASHDGFGSEATTETLIWEAIAGRASIDDIMMLLEHGFAYPIMAEADERPQILEEHRVLRRILNLYEDMGIWKGLARKNRMSTVDFITVCAFEQKYGALYSNIDIKEILKSIFIFYYDNPEELQTFINECTQYLSFEALLFVCLNQSYGYTLDKALINDKLNLGNELGERKASLIKSLLDKDIAAINKWLAVNQSDLSEVESCILLQIKSKYPCFNDVDPWINNREMEEVTRLLEKLEALDNPNIECLYKFFKDELKKSYIGCNSPVFLKAFFNKANFSMNKVINLARHIMLYAPAHVDANIIFNAAIDACRNSKNIDEGQPVGKDVFESMILPVIFQMFLQKSEEEKQKELELKAGAEASNAGFAEVLFYNLNETSKRYLILFYLGFDFKQYDERLLAATIDTCSDEDVFEGLSRALGEDNRYLVAKKYHDEFVALRDELFEKDGLRYKLKTAKKAEVSEKGWIAKLCGLVVSQEQNPVIDEQEAAEKKAKFEEFVKLFRRNQIVANANKEADNFYSLKDYEYSTNVFNDFVDAMGADFVRYKIIPKPVDRDEGGKYRSGRTGYMPPNNHNGPMPKAPYHHIKLDLSCSYSNSYFYIQSRINLGFNFLCNFTGSSAVLLLANQAGMDSLWKKCLAMVAYTWAVNPPTIRWEDKQFRFQLSFCALPLLLAPIVLITNSPSPAKSFFVQLGFTQYPKEEIARLSASMNFLTERQNACIILATTVASSIVFCAKNYKTYNYKVDKILEKIETFTDKLYPNIFERG